MLVGRSITPWMGAVLACLVSAAHSFGAAGPALRVDQQVHQFGKADSGTTVSHTFLLRNAGESELKISKVETACGCTVADLSEKIIAPGSEASLTVNLKLDPRWNGRVKKAVSVESNDSKNPKVSLFLEGEASPVLLIKPDGIFWGAISSSDQASQSITLSAAREDVAFSIVDVVCDAPTIDIEKKTLEEGKAYQVTVRTKPPLLEGDLRAQIRIRTDCNGYEAIAIPVTATVAGALAISPRQITIVDRDKQPITRYIVIAPGDVKSFKVEKVQAPPSIDVQVQPVGRNGYRIRLGNIVPSADLDGKVLVITTDVPQKKEIQIPIKVEHPLTVAAPK